MKKLLLFLLAFVSYFSANAQDAQYSVLKDGGRYYIQTAATAYSKNYSDYYLSSNSHEDYDVYLKSTPTGGNEIWVATLVDEDFKGIVMLQNEETGLYLHTNPTSGNEYGRYQSRPEEGKIVLLTPSDPSQLKSYEECMYLLWSNRSGAEKRAGFNSGMGDRYLVYPFAKGEGGNMGEGMYYSNEVLTDLSYGLVYRLIDVETGLPIIVPEEQMTAFDAFCRYMEEVNIPDIGSYREGTEPGCVKNYDRLVQIIDRLTALATMLDDENIDVDNDQLWIDALAEAKALLEELGSVEYYPMVPGFYRFVSAMAGFMDQQGVEKAMSSAYSTTGTPVAAWFTLDPGTPVTKPVLDPETGEPMTDPETGEAITEETGEFSGLEQIWEVTEGEDGHLYVKNVDMQLYIDNAATRSAAVAMTRDAKWIEFIPAGGGDFRLKIENTGFDLHTGGHSSGAGKYGNIVGWDGTSGSGSAWFCRPVSRDEIVAIWGEDFDNKAKLNAELQALIVEVEQTIAKAKTVEMEINMDSKLILSVDQISSEGSEESEGSLDALIDGDNSTYWHSCWSGGSLEFGSEEQLKHYLQFDLGAAYQNLAMTYVCRAVSDDKPISFSVTASNTADGEFVEVTTLENIGTTNNTVYKYELNLGAAYRYIRLRATDTNSGKRGYWHAAEMQFYSDFASTPNLFEKTGDVGTALEAALATAKAVENASKSDIKALRDAYEAFLAVYTDPTELKAAITKAQNLINMGGVGAAIGQKNDTAAFEALQAALDAAKALIEKLATCTKAELQAQLTALNAAIAAWEAVEPVKLSEGVWYYIQCPDEPFAGLGYNPVESNGYYEENTSLRGGRVAVGLANSDDADVAESYLHVVPVNFFDASSVNIAEGSEYEEISYSYTDECAQWRFIAAGEGKYYIQNRATGLFMPVMNASSGLLPTSHVPGAYMPEYHNGGIVNIVGSFVANDGTVKESCIHMQAANAVVVSWATRGNSSITNGSSWEIVEVENVAADHVQFVNFEIEEMIARGQVLPYAIDVQNQEGDEAMFLTDVVGIDTENKVVCFNETFETIEAGTPMFIYSEDEALARVAMVENSFGWNVKEVPGMRGTLQHGTVVTVGAALPGITEDDDNYQASIWGMMATVADDTKVSIGSVWLVSNDVPAVDADEADCDIALILDTTKADLMIDAVEAVKAQIAKKNAIYNINGQRVSNVVKGLYIVNGKKIVVK